MINELWPRVPERIWRPIYQWRSLDFSEKTDTERLRAETGLSRAPVYITLWPVELDEQREPGSAGNVLGISKPNLDTSQFHTHTQTHREAELLRKVPRKCFNLFAGRGDNELPAPGSRHCANCQFWAP